MRGFILAAAVVLGGCGPSATGGDPLPDGAAAAKPFPRPADMHRTTTRERLVDLLSKPGIPTEREVRALDPAVDSELANLANEQTLSQALRLEAVTCLGYFQNKRARLLLRSILTDPAWDKPYRVAALEAIARCVGSDAYETLKQHATDGDADIRAVAIRGLKLVGGAGVVALLKSLQLTERDPTVIQELDGALLELTRSPLEVN
ncbi:MAG: HEAT repeat domain-containing protein [Deltaproteobacteria bacterium]|nr:HEAT repeat domain-containing protein [Deltaproteobacteria bacterium]